MSLILALLLTSSPAQRVEGAGYVHVYDDGGSYGITLDGGVLLSAGTQAIYGTKFFDVISAPRIEVVSELDTPWIVADLDGQGVTIQGRRVVNDTSSSADVSLTSTVYRSYGTRLMDVRNAGALVAFVDSTGGIAAGFSNENTTSFLDVNGASGHKSLSCVGGAGGCYTTIGGGLVANYFGHHGAITLLGPADNNGFIAEFIGPGIGGAKTKLMVNYQGGLTQFGAYQVAQFASCLNGDPSPTDGGTVATDAGYAFDGTLMWAADQRVWCQCDHLKNDGGVGGGWVRLDGVTSCGP